MKCSECHRTDDLDEIVLELCHCGVRLCAACKATWHMCLPRIQPRDPRDVRREAMAEERFGMERERDGE